jgi:ABC-type dipeptide/oligopeptide/nickel transport system permease subunit/predicted Ser/Thr protein kinase
MDTWIGQQLGPYELKSKLGAGGMGVVYRAVHQRLGQARAIKVLPTVFAHDETFLQRFEREARLASELRHPNIVMIFDIAEEKGVNYIVMELLDGRSLHEVIRQDGPLPIERAIGVLGQLADALDFAHQRGVVHRDIKPGNALVGANDHVTLVDFGIARAAEGTRLTEANSRIGTAEYMSPETITLGESGAGTDLYALGVIAYEMLTGRVPFTGVNSQTIMYAQIHTPPPSPRSLRTDLPPAVEEVVLRQLDKDPTRRYPTGQAFVRALYNARSGLAGAQPAPDLAATRAEPAPTAWLEAPPAPSPHAGMERGTAVGETRALSDPNLTAALQPDARAAPKTPPRPFPPVSSRVPVPPPPTSGEQAVAPPPQSAIQRVLEESKLGMATIYKLTIGTVVLLLLLMTLLPTPRDPAQTNSSVRLAFPLAAVGGYVLGADQLGRDVLSRMMSGGRFLLFRLSIVGLVLVGATLLVRRQRRKRADPGRQDAGRLWSVTPGLIVLVTAGMTLSVLIEIALGFFGSPNLLGYSGPVGSVLLGLPRTPPAASWGGMLVEGRELGIQAPWLPLFPLTGLILVAIGLAAMGSGIVDVLKQRARKA